ncbi:glycosyltransferase family 2 protein [Natronoflexus pectinivorans]|uniref:Glycosyltransferase 2-like domain-containing protein n=1 Tax=Natronoflexus pectinivorans TaxID=682526 RepID=A0A4R2GLU0_9BACT|nr:glycosyltransferase family 2 protein [Natronoflexus pectinivorans]TCO09658.1 hypothetical protein EV194_10282 [Natronoflexus pectinivorans]
MHKPELSVVILNWNTRSLLEEFIPKVIMNSAPCDAVEIVLADNGSADDSVAWVRQHHPEVKVLELGDNLGFAGGYNEALSRLESEFAVLLNSDVAPGKGWLPPLLKTMNENTDVAACVPAIKDVRSPDYFEYAGAAGGFIDVLGYTFCRGRLFDVAEKDSGQYKKPGTVFWGSGAALMVNRKLFLETGGLDEAFFAHMEEVDWCWRVKNMGYHIFYVPESEVFHLGGGTLSYQNPNKTYLNFRNNLYMMRKNLHRRSLLTISFRILMDGLAFIHFLVKGETRNASAVFRAHQDFLKNYGKFKTVNSKLKQGVKKIDHPEIYHGSIVWDFFLRRKKYFHSLNFRNF